MSYFVTVNFGISGWADGGDESRRVVLKQKLEEIGLRKTVTGRTGRALTLPRNTFAGEFNGESAAKVRDDITPRVMEVFQSVGGQGRVFVIVSTGWAWATRTV